jgi:hypothetical protein
MAASRPAKAPEMTALQLDFIGASEAENKRQQSAEAQRLLEAEEAANKLQMQLNRANQALAQSINSDLALEAGRALTRRQRQALWKLAVADEPIKRAFVSIVAKSPNEIARVSPGFAQVSRALGLLRPSAAEMDNLLEPLLEQIHQTTDPFALRMLAPTLRDLAPKLSTVQASQALDALLKQIGQTTDRRALWVLAQALQALAPKLCGKVGDGVNQAADLISATASIRSLNFIPLTTFGNWF